MTKSDFELMMLALSSVNVAPDSEKSSEESQQQIAAAEQEPSRNRSWAGSQDGGFERNGSDHAR